MKHPLIRILPKIPMLPDLPETIGVLTSGGLDSCILLGKLAKEGHSVFPFYIRTGTVWQERELAAVKDFVQALRLKNVKPLTVLDMPVADIYGQHWSISGEQTPSYSSPDEAVFLPGRNALLIIKAFVWCQLNHVPALALAPLGTSPFADATRTFADQYASALNHGSSQSVQIVLPFEKMNKNQVMAWGANLPLEKTFSCISPIGKMHCGNCNKCAERQAAFAHAKMHDPTQYHVPPSGKLLPSH